MPQFEFDPTDADAPARMVRGRDATDAARRALDAPADAVALDAPDEQGWQTVTLDAVPAGRLRLHQRMRFRRD